MGGKWTKKGHRSGQSYMRQCTDRALEGHAPQAWVEPVKGDRSLTYITFLFFKGEYGI